MNSIKQPIGLIGVGLLGSAIASRLALSGLNILGFDVDRQRRQQFASNGVESASSSDDVLACCQSVILSLPTSAHVSSVLKQVESLQGNGSLLRTVIDTTTGDPREMQVIAESLQQLGVAYVEANVAGSSSQLASGQAALFLGGEAADIARVESLLEAISTTRFSLGPVGAASRFKLVHNLVLGLHRAVLAEGLAFAEAMGFHAGRVLEILEQTPAASAVMQTKGPKMVQQDWSPQARLAQHLKDVRLILEFAECYGAKTPLSEIHQSLLETSVELGLADADNSAILEAFRSGQSHAGGI